MGLGSKPGFWTPAAGGDPYWANTVLACHFDGSDGSTTITDATGRHTPAVGGSAEIDDAQSKFGGASLATPANTDYLTVPDSADWDFGSGDFTIEFWVRKSAAWGAYHFFVGQADVYFGSGSWMVQKFGGQIEFYCTTGGAIGTAIRPRTGNLTWTAGVWYHIAVTREGDDLKIFRDGVQENTTYDMAGASIYAGDSNPLRLSLANGPLSANYHLAGHFDDLRITKGVARSISLPTEPFPTG